MLCCVLNLNKQLILSCQFNVKNNRTCIKAFLTDGIFLRNSCEHIILQENPKMKCNKKVHFSKNYCLETIVGC